MLLQLVTILGAVLFSDYIFSWPNCAGLTLSMFGACWYAAVMAWRSSKKPAAEGLPQVAKDGSAVYKKLSTIDTVSANKK